MIKEILKEMIREDLSSQVKPVTAPLRGEVKGVKAIVVLQRGWVVVGDYFQGELENRLENASLIRKWGTSKGLGELALEGPKADTKLDECGTVRFNPGAEVCRMDCNSEKWS